jgi:hypothetical protein
VIAVRPRKGTLVDLAHVAEARQVLADATRCPGSGRVVPAAEVVIDDVVLCDACGEAVGTEVVRGPGGHSRVVVDHKKGWKP